jgi:hypothetical protein
VAMGILLDRPVAIVILISNGVMASPVHVATMIRIYIAHSSFLSRVHNELVILSIQWT